MKRNANTTAAVKARNSAIRAAAAARAAARGAALEAEPEPTAEQLKELAADCAAGYAADVRAELGSQLPKDTVAQHTTTERKSAERSTTMRNANTTAAKAAVATKPMTIDADTGWKFTPASIALNPSIFPGDYCSLAGYDHSLPELIGNQVTDTNEQRRLLRFLSPSL